jgi:hypothetical protein
MNQASANGNATNAAARPAFDHDGSRKARVNW